MYARLRTLLPGGSFLLRDIPCLIPLSLHRHLFPFSNPRLISQFYHRPTPFIYFLFAFINSVKRSDQIKTHLPAIFSAQSKILDRFSNLLRAANGARSRKSADIAPAIIIGIVCMRTLLLLNASLKSLQIRHNHGFHRLELWKKIMSDGTPNGRRMYRLAVLLK